MARAKGPVIDLGVVKFKGFAQLNDPHSDTVAPRARKDDYEHTVTTKLLWFRDYCNENELMAIFTGDIYHRKGDVILPRFMTWWEEYMAGFKHKPLVVPGNHDLVGGNPDTAMRKPIGTLLASGHVLPRGSDLYLKFGMPGGQAAEVYIACSGYDTSMENDPTEYKVGILGKEPENKYHLVIMVAHGMLMPEGQSFFGEDMYVKGEDLRGCGSDIIMLGHYHPRYKIPSDLTEYGRDSRNQRPLIRNPGALTRGTLKDDDLKRVPSFGVLLFNPDSMEFNHWSDWFKMEDVVVPHLPATDVFLDDREEKKKEEAEKARIQALVGLMQEKTSDATTAGDFETIKRQVMDNKELEEAVRDEVVMYLEKSAEVVGNM